jgi:hypothetical protein
MKHRTHKGGMSQSINGWMGLRKTWKQMKDMELNMLKAENQKMRDEIAKKIIKLAAMIMCLCSVNAQSVQRTLSWDYDTNQLEPDMVFRVHSTTNITISLEQWPVVSMVTNMVTGSTNVPVTIQLPATFFTVSVSNVVGITFSEVLAARLPASGTRLKLR